MPNRKNAQALKKLAANGRKSPPAVINNADDGGSLPTVQDTKFLENTPLPAAVDDRVFHGIASAYSPRVVKALRKFEVQAFIGSRLEPEKIEDDVALVLQAEGVADRMRHGAEVAQQIAAPPELRLLNQLALVVDAAPDLIARYPKLKDDLEPAIAWWTSTFPGGGPRTKANDKQAEDANKTANGAPKP